MKNLKGGESLLSFSFASKRIETRTAEGREIITSAFSQGPPFRRRGEQVMQLKGSQASFVSPGDLDGASSDFQLLRPYEPALVPV